MRFDWDNGSKVKCDCNHQSDQTSEHDKPFPLAKCFCLLPANSVRVVEPLGRVFVDADQALFSIYWRSYLTGAQENMANKQPWPRIMPPDLRARIDDVLKTRNRHLSANV